MPDKHEAPDRDAKDEPDPKRVRLQTADIKHTDGGGEVDGKQTDDDGDDNDDDGDSNNDSDDDNGCSRACGHCGVAVEVGDPTDYCTQICNCGGFDCIGNVYCDACLYTCTHCQDHFCVDSARACVHCGDVFCHEASRIVRCRGCLQEYVSCLGCATKTDKYCEDCFGECEYCGVEAGLPNKKRCPTCKSDFCTCRSCAVHTHCSTCTDLELTRVLLEVLGDKNHGEKNLPLICTEYSSALCARGEDHEEETEAPL